MLAVIGGSGIYQLGNWGEAVNIDTPWGPTSSSILIRKISGQDVAFIARHGIHHQYPPAGVPYRANIYALKKIGVTDILAISAVGSLVEYMKPGTIVFPNNILDFTKRQTSFFTSPVVHVGMADPLCDSLIYELHQLTEYEHKATYVCIEGPRFSTRAESKFWRSGLGADVVGMTAVPEAFLAREAGLHYAIMAHVTDYDSWRSGEEDVSVEMIINTLNQNKHKAEQIIEQFAGMRFEHRWCGCTASINSCVMTSNPVFTEAEQFIMSR